MEDLERPQLKRLGKKTRQKMLEFLETGDPSLESCGKAGENLGEDLGKVEGCGHDSLGFLGVNHVQVVFTACEG